MNKVCPNCFNILFVKNSNKDYVTFTCRNKNCKNFNKILSSKKIIKNEFKNKKL